MARVKERWDFRVESETDRLVRQAAATSQRTLTDFVVDAAVLEAERLLADRTEFPLEQKQWQRFVDLPTEGTLCSIRVGSLLRSQGLQPGRNLYTAPGDDNEKSRVGRTVAELRNRCR